MPQPLTTNDYVDEQMVTDLVGTGTPTVGLLHSCSIGLTSSSIAITRTTPLSAFTAVECAFGGYARQAVTWTAPVRGANGLMEAIGEVGIFQANGSSSPQSAYALFCVLSNGSLGFAGPLDGAPIPFNDQYDILAITIGFQPESGGLSASLPNTSL